MQRLKSSFIAALVGTLAIVIIAIVPYGAVSLLFGLFTFPVALCSSYLLSFPLYWLSSHFDLRHSYNLFLYFIIGFVGGGITPLIWLKSARTLISESEFSFIISYGFVGAATAITMFLASSEYSQYNKSLKQDK
jgi:hypothetical protein